MLMFSFCIPRSPVRNSMSSLTSFFDPSKHLPHGIETRSNFLLPHERHEYSLLFSFSGAGADACPQPAQTAYEWDGIQGSSRSLPSMSNIKSAPSHCFSCIGAVGKR